MRRKILWLAAALFIVFAAQAEEMSLNGSWRFAYRNNLDPADVVRRFTVAVMIPPQPEVPLDDQFAVDMPVPAYWDEELGYIPEAPWGNKVSYYGGTGVPPIHFPYYGSGRPRHPDAYRPYIVGVGWYKKMLNVPENWRGRVATLRCEGARVDTYCFVNGIYIDKHHGHDTPFEFDITDQLKYGQPNEIMLAVDNNVNQVNSCALRGYQGGSGGIYGDVTLHVSEGAGRIVSYYVYPENNLKQMRWKAELKAPAGLSEESRIRWSVSTVEGRKIKEGEIAVRPLTAGEVYTADWACSTQGIAPWSTWDPNLHQIEVNWEYGRGGKIDSGSRRYGLRQLESRDGRLYLNGRPIMLRGVCEIYFFPPRVHPPNDVEYFRKRIRRLKEVGFNYLRFHTWVPMQPYMQAADEEGMLLGPEHSISSTRNPRTDKRWSQMVRWCRYHPSVVTYCGGNEEVGHEGLIAKFAERYRQAKALAPDALILPMHTMSGPESVAGRADLPLPKHFEKEETYYDTLWKRVTRFSDLFAARANDFSYSNFTGRDWSEVEPLFTHYTQPILAHEAGIIGTYINLDLEKRYTGAMPSDLYSAARRYIEAAGRLPMADTYYKNSARWHGQARKYVLENLRKCASFDGYDLLGARDYHWHNSGYGCGLLNEFFELKPGDTVERILQYNGESVLLLDNKKRHIFRAGERFKAPVMVSLYGGRNLEGGVLDWRILDGDSLLASGQLRGLSAPDGEVSTPGAIDLEWPALGEPRHLVLAMELNGADYQLTNQWDFWVFPTTPAPALHAAADEEALSLLKPRYAGLEPLQEAPDAKLRVVRTLTKDDVKHLADGGDVLLLGTDPFPANGTRFQIGVAGRAHMNLATVIKDHPSLKYLPHEGWCDYQFQQLLENGSCVEFNKIPATFDPIVEVVSSYKYIRLQAAMWEAQTEGGRLMVAGFHFDMGDPASVALLDGILQYVQSSEFKPESTISIEETLKPVLEGIEFKSLKGNDGNYYGTSLF